MGKIGFVMNFGHPENMFVLRRLGRRLGIKLHDADIRDGDLYLRENNAVR